MGLNKYDWLWVVFWVYFAVVESIGIYHEIKTHGNDSWTLTHFLAKILPFGVKLAILVWLAYHFLIQHRVG